MPPLLERGGVEHGETEGIRKSAFDMANRNDGINLQERHIFAWQGAGRRGKVERKRRKKGKKVKKSEKVVKKS